MLNTEQIRKLLKNSKSPIEFNTIWEKVKDGVIASLGTELSENQVKSDIYMTMLEDPNLIMVGSNKWDLKLRYSHSDQVSIEKERMTAETELNLEETDETKELKLKVITEKED